MTAQAWAGAAASRCARTGCPSCTFDLWRFLRERFRELRGRA